MPIMLNLFTCTRIDTLTVVLQKMETLEENQREALLFRRSQGGQGGGHTALYLSVSKTLAELKDLEERLSVPEFRKRVVGVWRCQEL